MNYNFGIVLNTKGIFGGAEKRFTNLFRYLYDKYPGNAYYFVSYDLLDKIKIIYPDYPLKNVIPIGKNNFSINKRDNYNAVTINNLIRTNDINFLRKLYKWIISYKTQYSLFCEIEKFRRERKINVFIGVYSGILPLYFYLKKKKKNVGVIFSDMDSSFFDVLPTHKKYWYRKYSSFNFALLHCDHIDFLSPMIYNVLKERNIPLNDNNTSITPCSFVDYSKCKLKNKNKKIIVFASRLEPQKNPLLFLEAINRIKHKYETVDFYLMGDGSLKSIIERTIVEYNLKDKIRIGFYNNPLDVLAESSIFVSIQRDNNYPSQILLEAMGCGNAIVATDVGETRLILNENRGILIKPQVDELVSALEKLLNDDKLCAELGKNNYKFVRENHTVEKVANYYLEILKQTVLNIK